MLLSETVLLSKLFPSRLCHCGVSSLNRVQGHHCHRSCFCLAPLSYEGRLSAQLAKIQICTAAPSWCCLLCCSSKVVIYNSTEIALASKDGDAQKKCITAPGCQPLTPAESSSWNRRSGFRKCLVCTLRCAWQCAMPVCVYSCLRACVRTCVCGCVRAYARAHIGARSR